MTYIVIDINSDCDPTIWPVDTDAERDDARRALCDAGLLWEYVWTSPGRGFNDSYKNGQIFFATKLDK